MQFPTVTGEDLLRRTRTLPQELEGEQLVLLIAFQRWQWAEIDGWLPFLEKLEQVYAGLNHYAIPVQSSMNLLARTFATEGLRAGVTDVAARAATITLYLDKAAFRQALGLTDEAHLCVLLMGREGHVTWQAAGPCTVQQGRALLTHLRRQARAARRGRTERALATAQAAQPAPVLAGAPPIGVTVAPATPATTAPAGPAPHGS